MRRWSAAVLVFAAGSSRADSGGAVALDHLDRGVAAYRLGDYDTAHRELGLAQELAPDRPNPYRWLALTEIKQGDCRDALVHIEAFMSRVPVGAPRVPALAAARRQSAHAARPTRAACVPAAGGSGPRRAIRVPAPAARASTPAATAAATSSTGIRRACT